MATVSIFPNARTPQNPTYEDHMDVFEYIRNGRYKPQIDIIRAKNSALLELDKSDPNYARIESEKDEAKRNLDSILFQGEFTYRAKHGLTKHSGLATLDFDKVKEPEFLKRFLFENYKFVHAAFISPSGNGVKVVVRIPEVLNDEEYKLYYIVLLNYFNDASSDASTKDISRICFASYDPDIMVRDLSETSIFREKHNPEQIELKPRVGIHLRNKNKALRVAEKMISDSSPGLNMHFTLLKASRLLGGYVAGGSIAEHEAIELLETEIRKKPIKSEQQAKKTIRDGLKYGSISPIFETEEFERYRDEDDPDDIPTPTIDTIDDLHFPIEIYPEQLRRLITETKRTLDFPVDFTATSILSVFSTIIRNSLSVKVKNGYEDSAMIWLMQIAEPGSKKSYPVKMLYAPLERIEFEMSEEYKARYKEWMAAEQKGYKPKQQELIVKDFTIERLGATLDYNKAGIGLYVDELRSWIDSMGKYSGGKSNDIQIWLSIFSRQDLKVTRKTQDLPIAVTNPFVSIVGTIQPGELMDLNSRYIGNGFYDRFLFCMPTIEKTYDSEYDIDQNIIDEYNTNITSIFSVYNELAEEYTRDGTMYKIEYDEAAKKEYYRYLRTLTDKDNSEATNAALNSYISKLKTYFPRITLIIECIDSAFELGVVPLSISVESVKKAAKVIEYFYLNAELVYQEFNNTRSMNESVNMQKGKSNQEKVYELHEKGFKNKEIAKKLQLAEASVRVFIMRENKKRDK